MPSSVVSGATSVIRVRSRPGTVRAAVDKSRRVGVLLIMVLLIECLLTISGQLAERKIADRCQNGLKMGRAKLFQRQAGSTAGHEFGQVEIEDLGVRT